MNLHRLERFGVIAPTALKRVHRPPVKNRAGGRHNNYEEEASWLPSLASEQPTNSTTEKSTMSHEAAQAAVSMNPSNVAQPQQPQHQQVNVEMQRPRFNAEKAKSWAITGGKFTGITLWDVTKVTLGVLAGSFILNKLAGGGSDGTPAE